MEEEEVEDAGCFEEDAGCLEEEDSCFFDFLPVEEIASAALEDPLEYVRGGEGGSDER